MNNPNPSQLEPFTPSRGLALVVDDNVTNRKVLAESLEAHGYGIVEAENGVDAIQQFVLHKPNIVFMDVMMPVMDGIKATQRIKALSGDDLIPVIFVTAIDSTENLENCIYYGGGDEFITKPIDLNVLYAKIHAVERLCSYHKKLKELHARIQEDELTAKNVFEGSVFTRNVATDLIRQLSRPAESFSGDLFLSAHSPSRELYALLGDFTGHGLAAALGAMPVSNIFHCMTAKGHSPKSIVKEINEKLFTLLPENMFMTMQFVVISHNIQEVKVCNCAMPELLVVDGKDRSIKKKIPSSCFPLGILKEIDYDNIFTNTQVAMGDHLLLTSDGLTESMNHQEDQFGLHRLVEAITSAESADELIDSVAMSLDSFTENIKQRDDISLVDIPITPSILPVWVAAIEAAVHDEHDRDPSLLEESSTFSEEKIGMNLVLKGSQLSGFDPVPRVIEHFTGLMDMKGHQQTLFIILNELYSNAVEYGLLKMDPSLKRSREGMIEFEKSKIEKLKSLDHGTIEIDINIAQRNNLNYMKIRITDSGDGYDIEQDKSSTSGHNSNMHTRGFSVIKELCDVVRTMDQGRTVETIYSWSQA